MTAVGFGWCERGAIPQGGIDNQIGTALRKRIDESANTGDATENSGVNWGERFDDVCDDKGAEDASIKFVGNGGL